MSPYAWDAGTGPTVEYLSKVAHSWERFVANEPIEEKNVRRVVLDSWLRCRAQGVDPHRHVVPRVAREEELADYRDRNEIFLAAFARRTALLKDQLERSKSALVAADQQGVLLSIDGKQDLVEKLCNQWSSPGRRWDEQHNGTNAIGTALVLGQPVHIHAHEHFCEADKQLTCVAGLIRDPFDRQMLGVVDISTRDPAASAEIADMLQRLMCDLHRDLEAVLSLERTRVSDAFTRMQRSGDGLLAFDRFGRIIHSYGADRHIAMPFADSRLAIMDADAVRKRQFEAMPEWLHGGQIQWFDDGSGGLVRFNPAPSTRTARKEVVLDASMAAVAAASPSLKPMLQRAQLYAARKMPILLQGETGSGKDVIAKAIHEATANPKAPFVAVNCAALPKDLIASELFGHAEGAFTGSRRGGAKGRFEDAHGGTIFLDEIGDMPLELQPYLLRVLEDMEVTRLGEATRRKIDVRVIAATNRPLAAAMEEGRFRSDLFYRLNGASIEIPPLRERMADLPYLAAAVLQQIALSGDPEPVIGERLLRRLCSHGWPGNVRELRNVLECLLAASPDGILEVEDLPPTFRPTVQSNDRSVRTLGSMERDMIVTALDTVAGDVPAAAKALGISRATIYRRLNQYKIPKRRGMS